MSKFLSKLNLFGSASKTSPPAAAAAATTAERSHTMQQQDNDEDSLTSDFENRNMPTTQLEDVVMETQEFEEPAATQTDRGEDEEAEVEEESQPFGTQLPDENLHHDEEEAVKAAPRDDAEAVPVPHQQKIDVVARREESPRQSPRQKTDVDDEEEEETDEPAIETQMPEDTGTTANEENQDTSTSDEDETQPGPPETQLPEEVLPHELHDKDLPSRLLENTTPNRPKNVNSTPMEMQMHQDVNNRSPIPVQKSAKKAPQTVLTATATTATATPTTRDHRTVTFPPAMPARVAAAASPDGRQNNFQRYRSLSKVFTSLPDKLPDVGDMMCDMIEYLCQVMLMENSLDLERLSTLQIRLEQLLPQAADYLNTAGRINSRLQLVALKLDLAHSATWKPDDWDNAIQQLHYVRMRMLLTTANDPPIISNSSGSHSHATGSDNTTRNDQLLQHPSMTDEYKEAMKGLRWQRALAHFRENLTAATTSRTTSVRTIEAAIDQYRRSLQLIYGTPVPPDREAFVKADVYSPRGKQQPQHQAMIHTTAERLLSHIRQRHEGNAASSVLLRWAEVILDPPTLIQLSYGGVSGIAGNLPNHLLQDDDDDVSSMGQGDHVRQQQQQQQEQQQPFQPLPDSTTTRPVAALKLSAEEQDAVDQLAKVARPANVTTTDIEVEEETTTLPVDTRPNLPAAAFMIKKKNSDTVWPSSSDDDDDENDNDNDDAHRLTAEAFGGGRKKSIFRLWSMLQKKRLQQLQPMNNDTSSSKENADPRTQEDDDDEEEEEEESDISVTGNETKRQKTSSDQNDADDARKRSTAPVENSSDDDSDIAAMEHAIQQQGQAASLKRKSEELSRDEKQPQKSTAGQDKADDDEDDDDESKEDEDSSGSEEDANFIRRPPQVARVPQRKAAADVSLASRAQSAPQQRRDLLSDVDSPVEIPNRRRGRIFFTTEEDEAIVSGVQKLGPQWSVIQRSDPRLSKRSQTDIRCRYRNILKRLGEK
jgi:Myb-like DNA-binding domain